MSKTTCVAGSAEHNAGMTVIYAGAIATNSPVTKALSLETVGLHSGCVNKVAGPETDATIAANTDSKGTYKPYSAGTFSYALSATHWLIKNACTQLSGVTNDALLFTSADTGTRKAISRTEQYRTLHQSVWDWTTGTAGTTSVTLDYAGISGTTDHAARPTRLVPGELVILETGKTPTYKDYAAKTGG